jgi:ABC-type sugar transport system substrate-binding protein
MEPAMTCAPPVSARSTVRQSPRRLRAAGAVIAASTVIAAVGCSSSAAGSSAAGGTTASGTAANSACIQQARTEVAQAQVSTPITYPKLPTPATSLLPKGKVAWFLTPLSDGVTLTMAQGFQAAGKAAGVSTKVFDTGISATTANAAVETAVNNNAALIVIDAVPTNEITPSLAMAVAKHIPVISLYEPATTSVAKAALKDEIGLPASKLGAAAAAEALEATNCNLTLGLLYVPALSAQNLIAQAAMATVTKLCPSCKTYPESYNVDTYTTSIGPQAVTMVEQHPAINVIFLGSSDLEVYILPALNTTHPDVSLVGQGATPTGLGFLKVSGNKYIADVADGSYPLMGWLAMDAGLRALGSYPPNPGDVIPISLLTKSSDLSDIFPALNNYEEDFAAAWKS